MFNNPTKRTILALSGLALCAASGAALAHTGADAGQHHAQDMLGSFMQGATHPLTGLDHLAAMFSVGAWSALNPSMSKRLWTAPASFAATLLLGAMLGMAGFKLPFVEPMIAASLLMLGLLVASKASWSATASSTLVAAFALFHGVAHGSELTGMAFASLGGMLLTTASLHAAGISAGLSMRGQGKVPRWASRAIGAAVAMFGLSLLTPAIAAAI